MAFMKFIASIILGGGIGYGLLRIASPNEQELIKHLPPHSIEQQNFFKTYKQQPEEFLNQGRPNINLKKYKTQDNIHIIEK